MTSTLETDGRQRGVYWTAADLVDTHFPEPRWAVPGLIAEGLTILSGAPKLGKSWLCLDLGISIASGTPALGKIDTLQGDVLYAALEDPPRRLKSRLRKVLDDGPAPGNLAIVTELPNMTVALDMIAEWLGEHPDARLVIVDVLAKIRPPAQAGTSAYEADYAVLSRLKKLADDSRVAVVVVTHLRKMEASDVFDQVSGSTGLTGAADATLVVKRARGENAATMHVTGRDVVESEYAVTFDPERCVWTLDGEALAEAAKKAASNRVADGLGDRSAEILELVAASPGIGPTQVGKAVGLDANAAGVYLQRLVDAGRLQKTGRGRYSPIESVASVEGQNVIPVAFNTNNTFDTPFGSDE
ncbi:AAA family ATPase [Janibacter sp. FSL W8-0316]|uniref:AAA family ATPase n=1 Tax=Janibacter sp. FSL W8-0316 TaxID=2975325 RepID=UPI0030F902DC